MFLLKGKHRALVLGEVPQNKTTGAGRTKQQAQAVVKKESVAPRALPPPCLGGHAGVAISQGFRPVAWKDSKPTSCTLKRDPRRWQRSQKGVMAQGLS